MRQGHGRMDKEGRGHRSLVASILLSASMLTGCMGIDTSTGGVTIATTSVPQRVAMQIINNTCGSGDEEPAEESLSTGAVKGLSKVKDGFGIPYDEHADNYVNPPVPVTDATYETNKERGIGYCGYEAHILSDLKDGPGSHITNDIALDYSEDGSPFDGCLTPEEEMYGCCMRWEYSALGASGGIDGYYDFLKGNGSGHMQYVAIHAINTDKWCICCPYDYGPGHGLATTGGGKYAGGRIGGVTPAVTKILGFQEDGGCPDAALTEWWWVENSEQVQCGEVSDLSQFENGGGSSSSSSSQSRTATVITATSSKLLEEISRNSDAGDNATVSIAPANENSFVNESRGDIVTGSVDVGDLQKIVLHDLLVNIEGFPECYRSHFVIDEDGTIRWQAGIGQVTSHTGDPSIDGVSVGIALEKKTPGSDYPKAQLNSLDRLIAYIDQNVGRKLDIECHNETASNDLPMEEYQETRNHSGVTTVKQAKEALENRECSDGEESDENPDAGGPGIAMKAVEMSGSATPTEAIAGAWDERPTDSRLATYVSEKDRVYPGVAGWADCGRFAATSVKASGADDSFPADRDTAYQFEYMSSSQKWKRVGTMRTGDQPDGMCEPGDILVTEGKGHIMVYVGNDYATEKYSNTDANFAEASLGAYYGWCYSKPFHTGATPYAIFRCIKPDNGTLGDTGDADSLIFIQQSTPGACGEISSGKDIECGWCAGSHGLIMTLGDYTLTPEKIAQTCRDKYGITFASGEYNWNIVCKMCDAYGVPYHLEHGITAERMRTLLLAGCPVMATGIECQFYKADGSHHLHHAHSICFYKYEDGKYWAKDSSPSDGAAMCPYPEEGVTPFLHSVVIMGDDGKGNVNTALKGGTSKKTSSKSKSKDKGSGKSAPGTGSVLGRQIAWLATQMCPVASDQGSPLYEPNIYPWNKIPDSRLDNEFAIMDAEEELCPNMNCAYASCCQAACGVYAAVADMDALPAGNASGGPGWTAKWMSSHPEIYQKVDVQSMDDLKPGDILTNASPDFSDGSHGHVAIYVGNEMAQTKFPGTKNDVFQAGYGEGVHAKYPSMDSLGGIEGFRDMEYTAYRVIARNKNAQFPDIDWKNLIKNPSCKCPTGGDDDSFMDGDGEHINVQVIQA